MNSLVADIKGLFTVLNFLIFLLLLAWVAAKYHKKKLAAGLLYTVLILFLLFATPFLPRFLAKKLEQQYLPLNTAALKNHAGKIYIHLLGSGYTLDERLPATAQLGTIARCRLTEAMRLYRQLDSSVLVCSGGPFEEGSESQASVVKKAAVLLGADSSRILTLDTPLTTQEEAAALAEKTGISVPVIIVTDALHMPRAYKFFSRKGFYPIAAPANYMVVESPYNEIRFWPDVKNIELMDMVVHEYLGNIKSAL